MIDCPVCAVKMREVGVRANPGQVIILDQCPKCGGIWCDKWELFPIEAGEAARLEPADEMSLRDSRPLGDEKTLYCPRCTSKLLAAADPGLRPDWHIRRCMKCDGIWLNRGEFTKFKDQQQKVRASKLGAERHAQKLAQLMKDPEAWVVTGTQGMFAYPRAEEESDETVRDSAKRAAELVLQILGHLLSGI